MQTIWFVLVTIFLIGYVVLDGFDLGVGSVYLLVAKTEAERNQVHSSIGPIWDGNEVWLIAAGGTLFFAFPKAYAAAFSGFYLAFFLILWLLILRGLAIELRSQLDNALWHTFWDVVFSFASAALTVLLGVALGNLLRGIPFLSDGGPALPFWTNFLPGANAGLLDWYTLLIGGLASVTLVVHGLAYLALKTGGDLGAKVQRFSKAGVLVLIPLAILGLCLTPWVQAVTIERYFSHPLGLIFPLGALISLGSLAYFTWRASPKKAFIASFSTIAAMLATAAFGLYPRLLLNVVNPAASLTIDSAAASAYGLRVGLIWFSLGFVLLLAYVAVMYRAFWGQVSSGQPDSEY
jgi:cytochrome d ubiquinol oxidase subunit II